MAPETAHFSSCLIPDCAKSRVGPGTGSAAAATGTGLDPLQSVRWYVGVDRQLAILDRQPIPFDRANGPSLAYFADCLAAPTVLDQLLAHRRSLLRSARPFPRRRHS